MSRFCSLPCSCINPEVFGHYRTECRARKRAVAPVDRIPSFKERTPLENNSRSEEQRSSTPSIKKVKIEDDCSPQQMDSDFSHVFDKRKILTARHLTVSELLSSDFAESIYKIEELAYHRKAPITLLYNEADNIRDTLRALLLVSAHNTELSEKDNDVKREKSTSSLFFRPSHEQVASLEDVRIIIDGRSVSLSEAVKNAYKKCIGIGSSFWPQFFGCIVPEIFGTGTKYEKKLFFRCRSNIPNQVLQKLFPLLETSCSLSMEDCDLFRKFVISNLPKFLTNFSRTIRKVTRSPPVELKREDEMAHSETDQGYPDHQLVNYRW